MCHIRLMSALNVRQLHNETSAILDEVSKGKTFQITRKGKVIGTLQPAAGASPEGWDDIMAEVWAAQKKVSKKTPNPVLSERERRRR